MKIVINELEQYNNLNRSKKEIDDVPEPFLSEHYQQEAKLYNTKCQYDGVIHGSIHFMLEVLTQIYNFDLIL